MSEAQLHARAVQAARRMVAHGERPGYRLVATPDRTWRVDGLPGIAVAAQDLRAARAQARAVIAAALDVDPAAFDVEA